MKNGKPLVIVLSRNYSTGLGVIRSLGQAGFDVGLIASAKKRGSSIIASSSKYVKHSIEIVSPKIQEDSGKRLIDAVMSFSNKESRLIVFPTDDYTAMVIDKNRHLLNEKFFIPTVEGQEKTISELMDKQVQNYYAHKVGMNTPKEWIVSLRDDEIVIPEDIVFPCFVKPLQSVTGQKKEIRKIDSSALLIYHLKSMQEYFKERDVLIQEFLFIDKEYDLSGVCFGEKIFIPAVVEKTRISDHEKGVTMCGKMVSCDVLGDILDQVRKLLKELKYNGMFDMEIIKSKGMFYFNEINLRSGGPNYFYCLNGVNLPAILVDEIIGREHNPEDEIVKTYNKSFVYEKVAWEDYIYSHMTRKELKECINNADYTLLINENDPAPGKYFSCRIRLSAIKQKLKLLAGKIYG